jgi:hypothetical protein
VRSASRRTSAPVRSAPAPCPDEPRARGGAHAEVGKGGIPNVGCPPGFCFRIGDGKREQPRDGVSRSGLVPLLLESKSSRIVRKLDGKPVKNPVEATNSRPGRSAGAGGGSAGVGPSGRVLESGLDPPNVSGKSRLVEFVDAAARPAFEPREDVPVVLARPCAELANAAR